MQLIKTTSCRAETPSDIKNAVAMKKPRFSGYAQQDAQEFLAALLELLSLDLNRSRNPKYKELTADLTKHSLDEIVPSLRFRVNNGGATTEKGKTLSFVTTSQGNSYRESPAATVGTNRSRLTILGISP